MQSLECVWIWMTIGLKQMTLVQVNVYEVHDNHKPKLYNRSTQTQKKGTQR